MPSHYAHYYFGNQVLKSTTKGIKDIINTNGNTIDSFMIGLHGPDILFFYKAHSKNPINIEGTKIHNEKGKVFLSHAINYVKLNPTNENISYLLGFMCHFMLDTACHPLVKKHMALTNLSHSRIETEFDSFIIRNLNKDPLFINQLPHINDNLDLGKIIAPFYKTPTPEEINNSIKRMVNILNIVTSKNPVERIMAKAVLKAGKQYNKHGGMIVKKKPLSATASSNMELFDKLNEIITITNEELNYLNDSIYKDLPLTERSKLNFSGEIIK